jgi:hypothetical protein
MRRLSAAEICLLVGIIGCLLLALDAVWHGAASAQAWLAAWLFWIGLPVGALFFLLVHGLTGGRWGESLRPALLGMTGALPLLTLFLLPVLLDARQIYPWTRTGGQGWLDLPFFAIRAVGYLAAWNALALLVRRESRHDGGLPPMLAWLGLIVLFITTSLAAFDWVMTLEPRWTSTIFGLLVTAGWVLSALAAAILIALRGGSIGSAAGLEALARILLALLALWAYLTAIQLIVIWESDLVSEIPWYLRRMAGGWRSVAFIFPSLQFVLPFLMLLWQPARRLPWAVALAAASIVAAHLVEIWWLTVPDFSHPFGVAEPLAMVAIGGCVVFVIARDWSLGFLWPRPRVES